MNQEDDKGRRARENPVEILRRAIQTHLQEIHTAMPASIVSHAKGKATVQPLLNRRWADGDVTPLPIIPSVPIQWPRTAAGSLVFKIKKGDTGLIICSERALDEWLMAGSQVTPKQARTHSLSDAIFIPGLVPYSKNTGGEVDVKLSSSGAALELDGSNARLNGGSARLNLVGGKVALGAGGTEVLDVLGQLLTLLGASLTTAPGSPIQNQAAYAALAAQINGIKGSL